MQSLADYLTIVGDELDLFLSFHKFHQAALPLHLPLSQPIFPSGKWIVARLELNFYWGTGNI